MKTQKDVLSNKCVIQKDKKRKIIFHSKLPSMISYCL
jgi:hypothetical protein